MFLVAFKPGIGTLKRPTALPLSMAFTNSKKRWMEDAVIGAVFVVCHGFCDNRDGI